MSAYMRRLAAILGLCCGIACVGGAARGASVNPPEILTPELKENQVSQTETISVTFLVVGSAPIKSIKINGEAQTFAPEDTVQVTKEFPLSKGRNVITVVAEGEDGGTRERKFSVYYQAEPPKFAWRLRVHGEVKYENDDNPTDDVGLPYTVSGVDIKGSIPRSQRPDNRKTVIGSATETYGGWSLSVGGLDLEYEKSINKGLNALLVYGDAGYRFETSERRAWLLHYVYTRLSVGNADYATMNTGSIAYEATSTDGVFSRRHQFELDVTGKTFASSSQTSGTIEILKWNYLRFRPTNLSTFTSVIQAGNATEGIKATDYNFVGGDWDWHNRWDSGFRWDVGWGYQYRSYPNDNSVITGAVGNTRLDNLFRISTGFGWQWNPLWSAVLDYRYLTDLSNKAPYDRTIYGLTVIGNY